MIDACAAAALACLAAAMSPAAGDWTAGSQAAAVQPTRIEARSANLFAVALVSGERMIIHLSRLVDNAPLRDAVVAVVLRGTTYRTVAESDGSYALTAKDLSLPGAATVDFQVTQGTQREDLKGTLDIGGAAPASAANSNSRQLWWWVLNFGVCVGFLWLISRRKKAAQN